jgi:hypothetical protein
VPGVQGPGLAAAHVSEASRKGYRAEHALEDLEQARGLMVWRPRAGRARDCGDLAGLPLVQSVKDRGTMALGVWMTELESQVVHAGTQTGFVIHKRRGKGVQNWYVTTTVRLWLPVLDLCAAHLDGEPVR